MKEFFKRLSMPTPDFFRKWRNFFLFVMSACAVALVGEQFGGNFLMEWAEWTLKTAFSVSAIGSVLCQLPVYDWQKKEDEIKDV